MARNNQFFQLKSDCIDRQTSNWFSAQNQGPFVATSTEVEGIALLTAFTRK